jgi:hypothetical protein
MPIEIHRFGVGHRRPDGPPGTTGVTGQVIHSDARGIISELAFKPNGFGSPPARPSSGRPVSRTGPGPTTATCGPSSSSSRAPTTP